MKSNHDIANKATYKVLIINAVTINIAPYRKIKSLSGHISSKKNKFITLK